MMKSNIFLSLLAIFSAFTFFIPMTLSRMATDSKSLPRAALNERFSAAAAEAFLNAMQEKKMDLHSVMIVKDGKIIYERGFGNDAPGKNHVMWSVSKTWTTMAVGFAIAGAEYRGRSDRQYRRHAGRTQPRRGTLVSRTEVVFE
jgi:CubicO group peptidase (beta-lactamase class C family)